MGYLSKLLLLSCLSTSVLATPAVASRQQAGVNALVRDLDSADEATREAAIAALAKRPRKTVEELLAQFDSQIFSGQMRTGVIEVLGRMKKTGTQILEDVLLQRLHAGNIPLVFALFAAIGDTGPKAAWTSASLVKRIEGGFDQGFKEFNNTVIALALMTLGELGPTGAKAESVIRKHMEAADLGVKLSGAIALWWIGGDPEEVYPVLSQGLTAKDVVVLERAIFGLGEMGAHAQAALPALEALRDKVSNETKTVLLETIRKIEGTLPPKGPRRSQPEKPG